MSCLEYAHPYAGIALDQFIGSKNTAGSGTDDDYVKIHFSFPFLFRRSLAATNGIVSVFAAAPIL
jgi:hypothetical protein